MRIKRHDDIEARTISIDAGANRARRASTARRERELCAMVRADTEDASWVPASCLVLQTSATFTASAASFVLSAGPRVNAASIALGAGLAATAAGAQAAQLGISIHRCVDYVAAVGALHLVGLASFCASGVLLGRDAPGGMRDVERSACACLLGIGWLSYVAASAAQLHRDELAWGTTPARLTGAHSPKFLAALGGAAISFAVGGVAALNTQATTAFAHPVALGTVMMVASSASAVAALSGARQHMQ